MIDAPEVLYLDWYDVLARGIAPYMVVTKDCLGDDIKYVRADSLPIAPQPDWSAAPKRAEYYVVEADGLSWWLAVEPFIRREKDVVWSLADETKGFWYAGRRTLPIGIDWRTTLQRRPQES